MKQNLFIEGVDLWNEDLILKNASILVLEGVVKKIGNRSEFSTDEIKLASEHLKAPLGSVLLPSGVDEQVHLRTPGQSEKETPDSGLEAAACGGIGAVLSMPNTKPPIDDAKVLKLARELVRPAEEKYGVQVLFTACMTRQMQGQACVDFEALMKEGLRFFTDDGIGVATDAVMEEIFASAHKLGFVVLQHAEVPGHGGVLAPSIPQSKMGIPAYSEMAEVDMVARDLELVARYPKARYHVLHVSSLKTLDLVAAAKARGLLVTCEATPHHLLLTGDDIEEGVTSYKMNPPIRSLKDQKALRKGLQSGLIDFVATDHAPHEPKMKGSDFTRAAFGTTGLETSLRCLLKLYKDGDLSPERLVRVFSSEPARFLGIDQEFGSIKAGRSFRAVLVDSLDRESPVTLADLKSLSKNNCFLGHSLPGRIARFFGR